MTYRVSKCSLKLLAWMKRYGMTQRYSLRLAKIQWVFVAAICSILSWDRDLTRDWSSGWACSTPAAAVSKLKLQWGKVCVVQSPATPGSNRALVGSRLVKLGWCPGGALGGGCFNWGSVVKYTVTIKKTFYWNWKCASVAFALQDGMPVRAFVAEVLDQVVGVSVTRDEMVNSVCVPWALWCLVLTLKAEFCAWRCTCAEVSVKMLLLEAPLLSSLCLLYHFSSHR